MPRLSSLIRAVMPLAYTLFTLLPDVSRFLCLCLRPSPALAAKNLFLRKQLTLYQEHQIEPRRVTNATRVALVWLSWWCEWRPALAVVQPETFTRWRRQPLRLYGTGSPHLDGSRSRRRCKPSSVRWRVTTSHGVRGASRTNCYPNSACGSCRELSANMCPRDWTEVQATAFRPSAGGRSCTITRGPSSSMAFPVCRHGRYGSDGSSRGGGIALSRASGMGVLKLMLCAFPCCTRRYRYPQRGLRTP